MRYLKKDTAVNILIFMADETDGVTGKTGLTLTINASKAGAAFASISPTVTERTNGFYQLALTSSHTDTLGDLILYITGTNAIASIVECQIITSTNDDIAGYIDTEVAAIKAKTDNLPADPADASDIATSFSTVNSKLDAIDDYIDTEVAAIKAKTDNLPSSPAGVDFKKNTAFNNFVFPMQSTGLTVTAQRSIDGGALASCTNSVSEISNKLYKINLSADDLNGDFVVFRFYSGSDVSLFYVRTDS